LPVFAFAVAGLLLGHSLSYVLAVPDPHHRDLTLRSTGHAYLPAAAEAALILVLAALVALLVRAWSAPSRGADVDLRRLAGTLAAVQVGAFLGQEVLERAVSGAPLGDLMHGHLLATGVVVQIGVGVLGAFALRWLTRAAARIAGTRVPVRLTLPRPALVVPPPASSGSRRGRLAVAAPGVRAPPPSDVFPAS
jgi:hypothetical protein